MVQIVYHPRVRTNRGGAGGARTSPGDAFIASVGTGPDVAPGVGRPEPPAGLTSPGGFGGPGGLREPAVGADGDGDARSDHQLISAHVSGDPAAFGVLIRRHQAHLWVIARRTSATTEDAADCLQEALLSAHRMASGFRHDAAVRSWLHRIVVNACLDRIRRNRSRPAIPLGEGEHHEPIEPRDRIAAAETTMAVEHALRELPLDQRAAIVAVDMHGFSVSETARMLGVPEGTIKSRCARGRLRLAQQLGYLRPSGNLE